MIRVLAENALRDARQVAGSRDWMFRQLLVLADSVVFETWISLLGVVADKVGPVPGNPC